MAAKLELPLGAADTINKTMRRRRTLINSTSEIVPAAAPTPPSPLPALLVEASLQQKTVIGSGAGNDSIHSSIVRQGLFLTRFCERFEPKCHQETDVTLVGSWVQTLLFVALLTGLPSEGDPWVPAHNTSRSATI